MSEADPEMLASNAAELANFLLEGGTLKDVAGFSDNELEVLYTVGYNLAEAQKFDKALDIFKFLCLYDHTEKRWFYSLGVTQQKMGNMLAALEAYAGATILDMDDPRPQANAGYCLMALEKYPEAKSALEGAKQVCEEQGGYDSLLSQVESLLKTVNGKLAKTGE